jgi:hypothetical protein
VPLRLKLPRSLQHRPSDVITNVRQS